MEHRMPLRAEILKCKRALDQGEPAAAELLLGEALGTDSTAAIHWLKREKVLFAARSVEAFERLENSVLAPAAGLDTPARGSVQRLVEEHRCILTPLWHLQRELDTLPVWQLSRRQAVLLLLEALETIVADQRVGRGGAGETQAAGQRTVQEAARYWSEQYLEYGMTRSLLDAGVHALREVLQRCPDRHTRYGEPYQAQWIGALLQLAQQREFLQGAIDRYAYFDWAIRIVNEDPLHLELQPSDTREENALILSGQRTLVGDSQRAAELGINRLRATLRSRKADLEAYLFAKRRIRPNRLLGRLPYPLEDELGDLARRLSIATEVPQVFAAQLDDPEQPEVKAAFERLLAAWEYLIRLSYLHDLGMELARDDDWPVADEDRVIILGWADLVEGFARHSQRPRHDAELGLRELAVCVSSPPANADPFMTPLIRLSNSLVLLSPSYVLSSRHVRNVIKVLVASYGFNPRAAGSYLVRLVRQDFLAADFATSPDRPLTVPGPSGDAATDIDVAALKDGHLFIVEVRTHSLPDSRHEVYRAKLKILDAAENAAQGAEFARSRTNDVLCWMQLDPADPGSKVNSVIPMVVTNIREFSGLEYSGVRVTDYAALGRILHDPVLVLHKLDEKSGAYRAVQRRKLTSGPKVSGPELERFLEHPFWLDEIGEAAVPETTARQIGPVVVSAPFSETAVPLASAHMTKHDAPPK